MKLDSFTKKLLVPILVCLVAINFLINCLETQIPSYCLIGGVYNYCHALSLALLPCVVGAVFGLGLLFIYERAYKAWSVFTCFFLPIAFGFIFFAPENSKGFFPYDKFTLAAPITIIYFLLSLIVIFRAFQLNRKKK